VKDCSAPKSFTKFHFPDLVKDFSGRLHVPRGFSTRAVLIQVNGVAQSVIDSEYFAKIIDFSQFLKI
jgi:hypothetical protein